MEQLQLNGYEIAAVWVEAKPLGKIAASRIRPDGEVEVGDEFEVITRYRITRDVTGAEKVDENGNFAGEFAKVYEADRVKSVLRIVGYVTDSEREAAWQALHGAVTV